MVKLGIHSNVIRVIGSYLNGRIFQVRVDRAFSQLFLIFMSYMPWDPGTILAVYTDDTIMFSPCRKEGLAFRKLQRDLDGAVDWFGRWHFRITVENTVDVRFSSCIDKSCVSSSRTLSSCGLTPPILTH